MYDAGFENAMILGGVHAPGMTPYELAWLAKFPHLQLDKAQVDSDLVNQFTGIKEHDKATVKNKAVVQRSSFMEDPQEDGEQPPETPAKKKVVEFYRLDEIGSAEFWEECYSGMPSTSGAMKKFKKRSPMSAKEELMGVKVELERTVAECTALKSEVKAFEAEAEASALAYALQIQAFTKIICRKGEEVAIEKKEFKSYRDTATEAAQERAREATKLKGALRIEREVIANMNAEAKVQKMHADLTEKFIQHLALGGQPLAPEGGIFLNRHAIGYNSPHLHKYWLRLGAVSESWEDEELPLWKVPMGISVRPFMEWIIV